MVMDNGRYLGMPIPIIKHDNLNGYRRILTVDHESQDLYYQLHSNNLLIDQHSSTKKKDKRGKNDE